MLETVPIMARHHFKLRFGVMQVMQLDELTHYGIAVFVHKPRDKTRAVSLEFDGTEPPRNIAEEQEFLPIRALNKDHLATRRMTWRFDKHDARRDRPIPVIDKRQITI